MQIHIKNRYRISNTNNQTFLSPDNFYKDDLKHYEITFFDSDGNELELDNESCYHLGVTRNFQDELCGTNDFDLSEASNGILTCSIKTSSNLINELLGSSQSVDVWVYVWQSIGDDWQLIGHWQSKLYNSIYPSYVCGENESESSESSESSEDESSEDESNYPLTYIVSGAGFPNMDNAFTWDGTTLHNGKPVWVTVDSGYDFAIAFDGTQWVIYSEYIWGQIYVGDDSYAETPDATTYYAVDEGNNPAPTVSIP